MPRFGTGRGFRNSISTAWEYEKLTDNSAVLPVDLTELKLYMKVDGATEDDIITDMLKEAEDWFERFTGQTILTTQFKTFRDHFGNALELRRSPFISLDKIEFLDKGILTPVDLADLITTRQQPYRVISVKEEVQLPFDVDIQRSAVETTFTAGFGATEADIPIGIKQILKKLTLFYFENRGDCDDDGVPASIKNRAMQYKNMRIHVNLR